METPWARAGLRVKSREKAAFDVQIVPPDPYG
jgi:hypothetical protein